jgi:hypothetical protein
MQGQRITTGNREGHWVWGGFGEVGLSGKKFGIMVIDEYDSATTISVIIFPKYKCWAQT